ncbi:hypothetical protein [Arcticibacter sp. MXS-1]|uniref:hypothetical protein n=1 Tax=Arcticibacter sp. MXS-1 TaxID=3341726 RepID=UPI0035A8BCD3
MFGNKGANLPFKIADIALSIKIRKIKRTKDRLITYISLYRRMNMMRYICLSLISMAVLSGGCLNRKHAGALNEKTVEPGAPRPLEAHLGLAAKTFKKDSVLLSFTVYNHADTASRFCKWETPFEPHLGKYLEVKDEQGNEAAFKGAMARRVMPPPPESYISIPPHDSVKTVFNVARNYSLAKGRYTISYTGEGVSGLKGANDIRVEVTD